MLLAFVQVFLCIDLGDLRLKIGSLQIHEILSLGTDLIQPRLHLGLFREGTIREYRLILNLFLLRQLLKCRGVVVLTDHDVGKLQAVFGEAGGQLASQVVDLFQPPIAIELLRSEFAQMMFDARIGKADHDAVFVGLAESEPRNDEIWIRDAVENTDVDADRIAVDGRTVDGRQHAMPLFTLDGIVREFDDLEVSRKGEDAFVAEDLTAVAGSDELFLQAFVRTERNLAQSDFIGRDVRRGAAAENQKRHCDHEQDPDCSTESRPDAREKSGLHSELGDTAEGGHVGSFRCRAI